MVKTYIHVNPTCDTCPTKSMATTIQIQLKKASKTHIALSKKIGDSVVKYGGNDKSASMWC